MTDISSCAYTNCYFNNNNENTCIKDSVTVNATGMCESLMHCDDYVCSDCEMFDVCDKEKKHNFLNDE